MRLTKTKTWTAPALLLLLTLPALAGQLDGIVYTKDNPALPPQLLEAKIIYVGENHTEYSNHLKQLDIIKHLHANGKKVVIGMEMFYRSDQAALDDYIAGKSAEIEFLQRSRYFSSWGYNYNLYKEIMDYARENKIRVVGLNLDKEIIRGIGREGFRSLTQQTLAALPEDIDFGENQSGANAYKEELQNDFKIHASYSMRSFQNFYLAQIIRDEYMAESIHLATLAAKGSNQAMVVLAGNGHVRRRDAIPERAKRRNNMTYRTVLLDHDYQPGAADFFIYTAEAQVKTTPVLDITVSLEEQKVVVTGFGSKEAEANHALKKEDQILAMDDQTINTLGDLRLFLYQKEYGETVKITVLRGGRKQVLSYVLREYQADPPYKH